MEEKSDLDKKGLGHLDFWMLVEELGCHQH
jgi:hypothetical protein